MAQSRRRTGDLCAGTGYGRCRGRSGRTKHPRIALARRCAESRFARQRRAGAEYRAKDRQPIDYTMNGQPYQLPDGAVVVPPSPPAGIPRISVLMAGLLAKSGNAGVEASTVGQGFSGTGVKVVSDYLAQAKLSRLIWMSSGF